MNLAQTIKAFPLREIVEATVPLYRYDRPMRLGWKPFLPMSLGFVFAISLYLMIVRVGF